MGPRRCKGLLLSNCKPMDDLATNCNCDFPWYLTKGIRSITPL